MIQCNTITEHCNKLINSMSTCIFTLLTRRLAESRKRVFSSFFSHSGNRMTSEVLCDKVIGTKVAHDGSSVDDDDENNFFGEDDDNYNDIGVRVVA